VKNWNLDCGASSLEWALYSPTNTIPQLQHATSTIRIGKRMRVALALGDVAGSIVIGSVMVHFGEGLDWIDSFYLSDVTTVGYGGLIDHGRKTLQMLYENSA
jgi:hypothetical protein